MACMVKVVICGAEAPAVVVDTPVASAVATKRPTNVSRTVREVIGAP